MELFETELNETVLKELEMGDDGFIVYEITDEDEFVWLQSYCQPHAKRRI